MQKQIHKIALGFILSSVFVALFGASTAGAAPVPGSFNWTSDGTVTGQIDTGDTIVDVTYGGTPPTLHASIDLSGAEGSSGRDCGPAGVGPVSSDLELMGPGEGNIASSHTDCGYHLTGLGSDRAGISIGNTSQAPEFDGWEGEIAPPASQPVIDDEEEDPPPSTCNIDAIGWLICPVVSFIGWLTDGLYDQLEKHFLRTEPLSTDLDSPTYSVWSQVRNIANIAFILAFMVVVFSHISSIGLNNYSIKKILPRLIVAAILVNISYWVCAIAIDISNILGSHSKDIFSQVINLDETVDPEDGDILSSRSFLGDTVTSILAVTVISVAHFSILLPVLIAALAALVTAVAVLLLREALIILLIVIAPLAFVAFLLPNTEGLFTKWRKLLTVLLLMYPVIGAVFGASQLASQIVMVGSDETMTKIAGAGIATIPLFLTPVIMKTAGGVLNRFGGIVNNADKGVFDRMRGASKGYRENKVAGMNLRGLRRRNQGGFSPRGTWQRHKAKVGTEKQNLERELNRTNAQYIADLTKDNKGFARKITGGDDRAAIRAQASAVSTSDSLRAEEVKAATALIEEANIPAEALQNLALGKSSVTHGGFTFSAQDDIMRTAAIDSALKIATVKQAEQLVDVSGGMSVGQRKHLTEGLRTTGLVNKAVHLGGKTLGDIEQGNIINSNGTLTEEQQMRQNSGEKLHTLDSVTKRAAVEGKFSAQAVATSHPATLERLYNVMGTLEDNVQVSLRSKIEEAVTNVSTAGLIQTAQEAPLEKIYGGSIQQIKNPAPLSSDDRANVTNSYNINTTNSNYAPAEVRTSPPPMSGSTVTQQPSGLHVVTDNYQRPAPAPSSPPTTGQPSAPRPAPAAEPESFTDNQSPNP